MADFPITENPLFKGSMRKLESSDLAHADTFNPGYQTLLDNDNFLKIQSDRMKGVHEVLLSAAGWSAEAPYTQTVPVEGLTDSDTPTPGIQYPSDIDRPGKKAIDKAAGMLTRLASGEGILIAECKFDKPAVDIPLALKGV